MWYNRISATSFTIQSTPWCKADAAFVQFDSTNISIWIQYTQFTVWSSMYVLLNIICPIIYSIQAFSPTSQDVRCLIHPCIWSCPQKQNARNMRHLSLGQLEKSTMAEHHITDTSHSINLNSTCKIKQKMTAQWRTVHRSGYITTTSIQRGVSC
jgi:hypothetical protein